MNVRDNTKTKFDELKGGDVFSIKFLEGDEFCMKLKEEIQITNENCKNAYRKANAILLLTGELIFVNDKYAEIKHQNITLEIN